MNEELVIVHLLNTKWIHGFTYYITMCEAIESFANIHTSSSEQHKDLRPSSQARDHKDLETFLQWLKIHSPFTFADKTSVIAIATGLVADSSSTVIKHYDIGCAAATALNGQVFSDVKLKCSDRVKTISSSTSIQSRSVGKLLL